MIEILYEDNHIIVAVKPPNMLSQGDSTSDVDMLTVLKSYIKEKTGKPGNVYLGLVHRLDRPVGGLMVFAKTSKAASRLSSQLQQHNIGREYVCVAEGKVKEHFRLTDYLIKDPRLNMVHVCNADEKGAKLAILKGFCLSQKDGTSLCAVKLETGRNHQIRVQMAHTGAPIWGDNRYGRGIPGQQIALYGYKLSFLHPVSREKMTFYYIPQGSIWKIYSDELASLAEFEFPEEK